jgi:hypothetical protein
MVGLQNFMKNDPKPELYMDREEALIEVALPKVNKQNSIQFTKVNIPATQEISIEQREEPDTSPKQKSSKSDESLTI